MKRIITILSFALCGVIAFAQSANPLNYSGRMFVSSYEVLSTPRYVSYEDHAIISTDMGIPMVEVTKVIFDFEKNKITMPMQLFYFCSKIYKDQYEFRHPNIGKPGLVELLTIKEVAMYLLGNPTRLSYTKYLEITERMKWTSVSASSTFYKIEDGFCRISEDEYLAENLFHVDENDIDIVRNYLLNLLEEKDYISLLDFNDFSDLPEIDY